MVAIGFDEVSGSLIIEGNGSFPARTLVATTSPLMMGRIQIDDLGGRGEQLVLWSDVTSLDGSFTPASMADALAYLHVEFAKGPAPVVGPRGPGILAGIGEPDQSLGLAGDLYIDAISGDLFSKGD